MVNLQSKRSMKQKITVLFSIPFLCYVLSEVYVVNETMETLRLTEKSLEELRAAQAISAVIEQMQVERGKSAVFVKKSNLGSDFIENQRELVDKAVTKANQVVDGLESQTYKNLYRDAISPFFSLLFPLQAFSRSEYYPF